MAVGEVGPRLARVISDWDAEGLEPARDRTADAPHADETDGAVAQRSLGQRKFALEPLSGTQIPFGLRQLAYRAEEQPERRVGDFFGEHAGRVGDDDTALRRRRGVNVIVADAEAGDDLELRQSREQCVVDRLDRRRYRHRAHMRDRREQRVAVRGCREAVHGQSREAFGDDRP